MGLKKWFLRSWAQTAKLPEQTQQLTLTKWETKNRTWSPRHHPNYSENTKPGATIQVKENGNKDKDLLW